MRPSQRFEPTPFRCHPLLSNHHAQTIYATIFPRRVEGSKVEAWRAAGQRREFVLADGDRLTGTLHTHPDDPGRERPTLVLCHGLEGSEDSHYIRGLSIKAHAVGFNSLRLNYRGCDETERLSRKLYNGHMYSDVGEVIARLAAEAPGPFVPVGISLGANLVLKLMASYGDAPPPHIAGAVAIGPPIDFHLTTRAFSQGVNQLYDMYFLWNLRHKMAERERRFAHDPDEAAMARKARQATRLHAYDQVFTAPQGGFASAEDYYTAAGTGDGLALIRVPTLILHAEDDPLIPMTMFEQRRTMIDENPFLTAVFTPRGGHVGFMESDFERRAEPWMDAFWAENQAVAFARWAITDGNRLARNEVLTP